MNLVPGCRYLKIKGNQDCFDYSPKFKTNYANYNLAYQLHLANGIHSIPFLYTHQYFRLDSPEMFSLLDLFYC